MEDTAQRMTTVREQLANSEIPVPKENLRIVTLADRWTSADCCIGDSCASSHELTRSEKLVALVQLLRSHWISAEHYCLEYLERLTATDPDLYFVALRDGTPVGVPIYSEMVTSPNSGHCTSRVSHVLNYSYSRSKEWSERFAATTRPRASTSPRLWCALT